MVRHPTPCPRVAGRGAGRDPSRTQRRTASRVATLRRPWCCKKYRYVKTDEALKPPDDEERLLQREVAGYDQPALLAKVADLPWAAPGQSMVETVVFYGKEDRIKSLADALQQRDTGALVTGALLPLFIPSKGKTAQSGGKIPNRTGLHHANLMMREAPPTVGARAPPVRCARPGLAPSTPCGTHPATPAMLLRLGQYCCFVPPPPASRSPSR